MNSFEYLEKMKKIQISLLDFLDNDDNIEANYQNLNELFEDIKIHDSPDKFKPLLHLILKISNNHFRKYNFFNKIEQILLHFKDDMLKYFTNLELFQIFQSNKRILLFLFDEKIITINEPIVSKMIDDKYLSYKYLQYFSPEISSLKYEEWYSKYDKLKEIKEELPNDFLEKRKIGENDNEICQLLRKDLIKEFIVYINKNSYSLIKPSIYETNQILLKNEKVTLIEYATFYGSYQIFNYLKLNGAELKQPSLLMYAVHGQNSEIFQFLEENQIKPHEQKNYDYSDDDDSNESDGVNDDISFVYSDDNDEINNEINYEELFKQSVKCHNFDFANYFQINYLTYNIEKSKNTLINGLKYYNFMFMQNSFADETLFYYLCKYDHCFLVNNILKEKKLDLNKKIILMIFFLSYIVFYNVLIGFGTICLNRI